jgi:hypothetical protein
VGNPLLFILTTVPIGLIMEGFQLLKSAISVRNCVALANFVDRKTNKMDDDRFFLREVHHIGNDETTATLNEEIRRYISARSGCLNVMVQRYKKGYVLPLHKDNESEDFPGLEKVVILNVSGDAVFQIVDVKYPVSRGDVIIMVGPSVNALHGVPETLSERNNIVLRHFDGPCRFNIKTFDLEKLVG